MSRHPMTAARAVARGLLALVGLVVLASCGRSVARHYYTLTYPTPAPLAAEPLDITLRIKDVDVRDTYRGSELVFRPDVHEIRFYKARRWSERPEKMLSALLRDHLRSSGIVRRVTDSIDMTPPDYTLSAEVEAIEQLESGTERYARLSMTYRLTRFKDDRLVWTWAFDERREVSGENVRGTVRALSALFAVQTQEAISRLHMRLAQGDAPTVAPEVPATPPPNPAAASEPADRAAVDGGPVDGDDGMILPSPFAIHPQLQLDDTPMPMDHGAIFLPTLSTGIREPLVLVIDAKNETVAEGRSGERIVVKPGEYRVRFGSGAPSQQRVRAVKVEANKVTLISEGSWAGLDVRVVNPQFVPFRGTYELISAETREDFGVGFGADALLGEQTRVWVLKPGLYKIIRSGGTYRDRTDFATVRLKAGEMTTFTVVQDELTGDWRGAGEVTGSVVGKAGEVQDNNWQLRAVVGGDFSWNRSNRFGTQDGVQLQLDAFLDGTAIYNDGTHLWSSRLDLEVGLLSPVAADEQDRQFRTQTDRLFANTIYVYQLMPWFGPYGRLGLESQVLERKQWFDEDPRFVIDEGGAVQPGQQATNSVVLGQSFEPLTLFQGAGGNFRILRTRPVELDVRAGVGGRQTLAGDLKVLTVRSGTADDPDVLTPVQGNESFGFEGTVVGLVRMWRLIATTEFDGLIPVTNDDAIYTWRNQVSLRLASFMSINYRFNVVRDPNLGLGDEARTEHDVQVRFSYNVF